MIAILWRYQVRAEHREMFERTYASDGDWAQLFAQADGYIGTELLHGDDGIYMTIDRWRALSDFEAFQQRFGDAYRALDALTEGWTVSEERIGLFNA